MRFPISAALVALLVLAGGSTLATASGQHRGHYRQHHRGHHYGHHHRHRSHYRHYSSYHRTPRHHAPRRHHYGHRRSSFNFSFGSYYAPPAYHDSCAPRVRVVYTRPRYGCW